MAIMALAQHLVAAIRKPRGRARGALFTSLARRQLALQFVGSSDGGGGHKYV